MQSCKAAQAPLAKTQYIKELEIAYIIWHQWSRICQEVETYSLGLISLQPGPAICADTLQSWARARSACTRLRSVPCWTRGASSLRTCKTSSGRPRPPSCQPAKLNSRVATCLPELCYSRSPKGRSCGRRTCSLSVVSNQCE